MTANSPVTPNLSSSVRAAPLVVDLDGTLTKTDTLFESMAALLRRKPWCVPWLLLWLLAGRAQFKARVAKHVQVSVSGSLGAKIW